MDTSSTTPSSSQRLHRRGRTREHMRDSIAMLDRLAGWKPRYSGVLWGALLLAACAKPSPVSCAAFANGGEIQIYVRPQDTSHKYVLGTKVGLDGGADPCGSTEEDACPNIASALRAIPDDVPDGISPELRLLPGLYIGNQNVFIGGVEGGGPYPSNARNVRLIGWVSAGRDASGETDEAAVLSCQGQRMPKSTSTISTPVQGVWLSKGRIIQMANLTVTDCPAGGVGVELWSGDDSSSASASLTMVTLTGNGGDRCERGGGLLIVYDGKGFSTGNGRDMEEGFQSGASLLTVSNCTISNNTAQVGGGIAIGPTLPSSHTLDVTGTGARPPTFSSQIAHRTGNHPEPPRYLLGANEIKANGIGLELPAADGLSGDVSTAELRPRTWDAMNTRVVLEESTTVSDNHATHGGGIWVAGAMLSAVDDGVLIRGNTAGGLLEGCLDEEHCVGRGGGMYVDGGSVSLASVLFEGNRAEAHQSRDEHARGGGLWAKGGSVSATECSFVGNSATAVAIASAGIGGGVYLDDSNATFSECRFESNLAEGSDLFGPSASAGGGLATRGPDFITNISDSTFVANAIGKGGSGGGVWVEDGARAVLSGTTFVNNTAASSYKQMGAGGAIAVSASARVSVSDGCVFEGNVARPEDVPKSDPPCLSGEGGAIHSFGSGITMDGVTFRRNHCETGSLDTGCSGGAISLTGRGLSASRPPSSGRAAAGAAAATDQGGASFEGCIFENNEARGAVSNSVYSGAGQGGAVAIRFASPIFKSCTFDGNAAGGGGDTMPAMGGAVYLLLSRGGDPDDVERIHPPTFVDCVFDGNRAGADYEVQDSLDGSGRTGRNKQTHGTGGAMVAIASSPVLQGCSFVNNTAVAIFPSSGGGGGGGGTAPVSGGSPSYGGAIALTKDCSGTRLENCTLADNAAINGVGGDLAVLAAPSGSRSAEQLHAMLGAIMQPSLGAMGSATSEDGSESSSPTVRRTVSQGDGGPNFDAKMAPPRWTSFVSSFDDIEAEFFPAETTYGRGRDGAGAGAATVLMSRCRFRPPPPQTKPAVVPWGDGRSETDVSPFLFVLNGGTVELASPVFEAGGQAFVAQVDSPYLSGITNDDASHLRIIDYTSPSHAYVDLQGTAMHINGRTKTTRNEEPADGLSIVSVGGKVSLGHSDDTFGSGVDALPFSLLRDVLLLGGAFIVDRGAGVIVTGSARWRMANMSSLHDTGTRKAAVVELMGQAHLGGAWEPKPFFLGTRLSHVFPAPRPSVSEQTSARDGAEGGKDSKAVHGDGVAAAAGAGSVGDDRDDYWVELDGVVMKLTGEALVAGRVRVLGSAVVEVDQRGSLVLAGDTAVNRTADRAISDSVALQRGPFESIPTAVIRNRGILSFPRGWSLTVDGGIVQGPTGQALVALPAPLYLPHLLEVAGPGTLPPLVVQSGVAHLGGVLNVSASTGGGEGERVKMHRKWAIIRFASIETASDAKLGSLMTDGPPGVSMRTSMRRVTDTGTPYPTAEGFEEQNGLFTEGTARKRPRRKSEDQQLDFTVEAEFIECRSMMAYANSSAAGGPCQSCLLNLECAWCAGKGCIPIHERSSKRGGRKGQGVCQVGNCCPRGCNGVGKCDFYSATCSCPWLYAGTSCAELSTKGAVTLSLSLSAILLLLLTLACGRSSRRKQMQAVAGTLQELKEGLLSEADASIGDDDSSVTSYGVHRGPFSIGGRGHLAGGGGRMAGGSYVSGGSGGLSYQHMWPRDYIQDLQQNLALRDVMVSFGELEVTNKIGEGAAGSVWRGSWRGAAVAVKVIRRPFHQAVELTGRDLEVFKREAYLMTRLRHPNIVLIMGVTFAPPGHRIALDGSVSFRRRKELGFDSSAGAAQGSLCIVTELLSRGSLEDVIREGGLRTASYSLILSLALQAARGMLYLHTHSPSIVHRDLKSSNLVVDEHWHVKVTDFGMSRFVPEPAPTVPASPSTISDQSSTAQPRIAPGEYTVGVDYSSGLLPPAHPLSTPSRERRTLQETHNNDRDDAGDLEEKAEPASQSEINEQALDKSDGRGWGLRSAIRWGKGLKADPETVASNRSGVGGGITPRRSDVAGTAGLGRREDLGLTTNLGTVAWAAPEMLIAGEGGRGEYTSKVDVYSFGVVLWELWERRRPFENLRSRFDIADTVTAGGRPPIGRGCPPPYAELIRACWHQDPTKRPLFQDVVEDLEAELSAVESLTEL